MVKQMKRALIISAALSMASIAVASSAQAVVTTIGAGSAVTEADRTATFDGLLGVFAESQSLLGYAEDGLLVSVDDVQCCFPGVHYANGGTTSFVTISTTDGVDFFGLELDLGTGFADGLHNVVWETQRDGMPTDAGVLTNIFASTGLRREFSVLGWSDTDLFDTLLIGAAPASRGYSAFGQGQAIALDNVRVDFGHSESIPEPSSFLVLLGFGLAGIALSSKSNSRAKN